MKNIFEKILLVFVIAVLFVPIIQSGLHIFPEEKKLDGEYSTVKKPGFSVFNFLDRTYQDSFDIYINRNFDCRAFYIREHNNLNYRLFRYTTSPGVVIGKKDYLFIESYINEYIGQNFQGYAVIHTNALSIKTTQDSLKKYNVDLLVIFAPGKASFDSEYIPTNYLVKKKDSTNYKLYCSELKKLHVNFIDLNAYFLDLKNRSKYTLYSKYGTHWSYYGMGIAMDTIIKYIQHIRHIDMPDFSFNNVEMKTDLIGPDYDVGELLNIRTILPHDPMPYPNYSYRNDQTKQKPSVLAIGDSYWRTLIYAGMSANLFKQDLFWDYFKNEYIDNKKQETPLSQLNLKEKILQQDVVIIEATEANFQQFPFGFTDKLNISFGCAPLVSGIERWKQAIRNDKQWLEHIKQKALENKISLDSMLYINAKYMLEQEGKK